MHEQVFLWVKTGYFRIFVCPAAVTEKMKPVGTAITYPEKNVAPLGIEPVIETTIFLLINAPRAMQNIDRPYFVPNILSKKSVRFCILEMFNTFRNKPWFLCVCSTSLLKTQLEKVKSLVTSNFSFSHSVF